MLRIIAFAVLVLNSLAPRAQENPAPDPKNNLDTSVRYGHLANGLTYYIKKNNYPAGKIEMRLVVDAGWQHEDPDQLGLAHLLEHMAFNGTRHFPGDSMSKYAAKSDVILHAETGEYTVYDITLPSGNKAIYKNCLLILKDWATDLTLDSAAIDDERGVVLSEFRSATPELKALSDMHASLYHHAKYPKSFYENHDSSIKTFQHHSLTRFFKDWYRPDNEAIIIVGDINGDSVERDLQDFFGNIQNSPNEKRKKNIKKEYAVHLNGENKLITGLSDEITETNILILLRRAKEENNLTDVTIELYNLMARDRFETVVGPFSTLYHKIDQYGGDARSVLTQLEAISTGIKFVKGQPVDKGIKIVLQELERIRRYGFTEGELKEAKSKLVNQLQKINSPTSGDLSYRYLMHFVHNEMALDAAKEITQKKLSDINWMIKAWMSSNNNRHILITANREDSLLIPNERLMDSWIKESKLTKLMPYKYEPPVSELIPAKDIPAITDGMACGISDIAELGIRELKFENGVKVILKPIAAKGAGPGKIYLKGFSSTGANSLDSGDYQLARKIPEIISQSGLNGIRPVSLNKFLQQKEISFDFSVNDRSVNFDISTRMENAETMLQIIYLYFTRSKPDAAAFAAWMLREKEKIAPYDPAIHFNAVIDSLRFPGKVKLANNNENEIEHSRWDTVFRQLLGNAGKFTFVITGNFDIEKISSFLFRYLCTLPGQIAKNDSVVNDIIPTAGQINKSVYAGPENTEANVRLFFPSAYYPSVGNDIFLEFFEEALKIKMNTQLRENTGGTYFVITSLRKYKGANNVFCYEVEFQCDRAASEKMCSLAVEVFEKLRDEGIDPTLFEMVRNQGLNRNSENMASSWFWSAYLTYQYAHHLDRTDILKNESIIRYIITREGLNTALKDLLGNCSAQRFVLLPGKKR